MLPPYYFYWFRIDIKHMTEPSSDQVLIDSAYRSAIIPVVLENQDTPGGVLILNPF